MCIHTYKQIHHYIHVQIQIDVKCIGINRKWKYHTFKLNENELLKWKNSCAIERIVEFCFGKR